MEENKNEILQPTDKFYKVKVVIDGENPDNGKPKKTKEIYLVDAACPTEVENKVKEVMEGTIFPWKIVSMSEESVQYVLY